MAKLYGARQLSSYHLLASKLSTRLFLGPHSLLPCMTTLPRQLQVRGFAKKAHKKIIKQAKGFRGRANRVYSIAYHRVMKAKQYAYRDRKVKKRDMRSLWIMRINAATRAYGMPYSTFIYHLHHSDISLNRKVLSELAITEPLSFRALVEVLKDASQGKDPKDTFSSRKKPSKAKKGEEDDNDALRKQQQQLTA